MVKHSKFGTKGRYSMRVQWMNEYSDMGSELGHVETLKLAR